MDSVGLQNQNATVILLYINHNINTTCLGPELNLGLSLLIEY